VRKVSPGIFAMSAALIVICAEKAPDADDWDEWTYLADCAIAAQNIQVCGPAPVNYHRQRQWLGTMHLEGATSLPAPLFVR
jgi:hypothetical protein